MSALAGKRIVVTRAAAQADELVALLRSRGAEPLAYPCIEIAPPADTMMLDATLHAAADGRFDWLALTSPNAVDAIAGRLASLKLSLPPAMHIAAVGPATAARVRSTLHGDARVIATDDHSADALAKAMPLDAGARVLLPQSALADETLARALAARGAIVAAVTAYEIAPGRGGVDLPAVLKHSQVDALTVTSGSTAANLIARVSSEGGDDVVALLRAVPLACIGRRTADAARKLGLAVAAVAERQTAADLVAAVASIFEQHA